MYYGGDTAELLLAVALVATWRPARRPAAHLAAPPDRSPGAVGAVTGVPGAAAGRLPCGTACSGARLPSRAGKVRWRPGR
jgi:putative membrane protein